MSATRHYLDNNATTPLRPEARAAMIDAMDRLGNPSSVHAEGRAARAILDHARRQVADLAGVSGNQVYFTSGATEANNWALAQGNNVAAFAESHDSVLKDQHVDEVLLEVDPNGLASVAAVEACDAGLVSVAAVNNETGVVQPVKELALACRARGARLHADAVQVPGKTDLAAILDSVSFASLSAHKLGGPPGVGALIAVDGSDPRPIILGGGQENRRRAGTENLIGIVGFASAAAAVAERWQEEAERIERMRERLQSALCEVCPGATVYGQSAKRVPNTLCVRMPGVSAETQVMAMDLAGVAVSAGSACSSGKVTPSHVLRAMDVAEDEAAEAIRISLGWASTDEDVDACIRAWDQLWKRKRAA